jgi:hypothetical protein
MIELALHYASHGWPVFRLAPGAKGPLPGSHGFKDATFDVDVIERWWTEVPNANIGIQTGRRSGLLVVDVDPRKTVAWRDSLRDLSLPPTFTVRTASDGFHLYFSFSGDKQITIGANLLPGIDWRGNGGYVVAVGSVVNGATYLIERNMPIARAPEALLKRLCTRKKLSRPVHDVTGHMVIPDGARNETLFALACLQRRFGIEYNAILQGLRATNADHCEPPLSDVELRQIAASAMRYRHMPREPG